MNQTERLSASEILKRHEDSNEMHFYNFDRKWIIEAMEEYAQQFQSNPSKLVEALEKIAGGYYGKVAIVEIAQQALESYKDGWVSELDQLEKWVEDTFSDTNDYGTNLTATGEQIMQKIQELKSPPQTKTI